MLGPVGPQATAPLLDSTGAEIGVTVGIESITSAFAVRADDGQSRGVSVSGGAGTGRLRVTHMRHGRPPNNRTKLSDNVHR